MIKALITGGGGFVGGAIIKLLQKERAKCVALGRNAYPHLENTGVSCIRGDLSDREFVLNTVKDFDVVFHVAALAGIWGPWNDYYNTNILGTKNIVEACLENQIKALVYTSTPSVVFGGKDIINGDESLSYPTSFLCNYARSKAIAEKAVLDVNQDNLKTCAIRPHLIWGPNDPHLIPRLMERGREGQLKIVGKGDNLVDITYIENVAYGHILAAKNLLKNGVAAGKPYFLGQENPVNMWEWINDFFQKVGIAPVTNKVSFALAYTVGYFLEMIYRVKNTVEEPKMTRFLAQQMAMSHCFSHENAKQDLGYEPLISMDEGMERLIFWLRKNGKIT